VFRILTYNSMQAVQGVSRVILPALRYLPSTPPHFWATKISLL